MRAAVEAGVQVPKLCATDSLESFGSCRLCLVEIEGRRGTPASCTTPCGRRHAGDDPVEEAGQASPRGHGALHLRPPARLPHLRRPTATASCRTWPVRWACATCATRHFTVRRRREPPRRIEKDASNPYFTFDPSKCIVCSRCVRACEEIQGTFALTVCGARVRQSAIAADGIGPTSCRPTACRAAPACRPARPSTLMEKSVIDHGVPDHARCTTTCAYCGVGCSLKRRAARATRSYAWCRYKDGKANHGHSLRQGTLRLGLRQRTRTGSPQPLIRKTASTEHLARGLVGRGHLEFAAARDQGHPGQSTARASTVGGITSSRCTNEEDVAGA